MIKDAKILSTPLHFRLNIIIQGRHGWHMDTNIWLEQNYSKCEWRFRLKNYLAFS